MTKVSFKKLWDNHPYPKNPCSKRFFQNQCAIRMGVALLSAKVDLSTFRGAKCYPGLKHNPRHILRAQELANWIKNNSTIFGIPKIHKEVTHKDFAGKKGIVFIKDGWGPTDHIDVWNGVRMKGGSASYFANGKEVWFWELV